MQCRLLVIFAFLLFLPGVAPTSSGAAYPDTLEIGLDAGYRQDRLNWRISDQLADTGGTIVSELRWEELEIRQLGLSGRLIIGGLPGKMRPYFRGSFNYGRLNDGHSSDSDYFVTNHSKEFSRSQSRSQGDYVLDGTLGAGLQWRSAGQSLAVALLGGYSHHEQKLRLSEGRQVLSDPASAPPGTRPQPPGPFTGLNSTYHSRWQGPWLGVDLDIQLNNRFSLLGQLAWHWANFDARARWNLRRDLAQPVSFRQAASDARGVVGAIALRYALSERWALVMAAEYQEWRASGGTDTVYFVGGGTAEISLDRVNRQTAGGSLGITHSF